MEKDTMDRLPQTEYVIAKPNTGRILTLVAGLFIAVIVTVLPLGYFLISYQYIAGSLVTEAEINAAIISHALTVNPELYEIGREKLNESISQRLKQGRGEIRRLLDEHNVVVAESADEIAPPFIMRFASLTESGATKGKVEIYRSLRPLFVRTFEIALVSIFIGGGIFFTFFVPPLRAIRRTEDTLQKSEERYRTLAEAAQDIIFIIDRNDNIQYLNNYAAEQLGRPSEEIIGKPRNDLFPPDMTEPQKYDLEKVFENGESFYTEGSTWLSGREIWLSTSLVPIRSGGKVTAVLGISRDITERKKAQDALMASERHFRDRVHEEVEKGRDKDHLLMQQSKLAAMGEMIGSIAHQWRQPLNTVGLIIQDIKTAYQLGELDRTYLNNSVAKAMEIIRHMSSTIDDFRYFYKPEKEPHTFRIAEAVVKAVSVIDASFKNNNIEIDLDIRDDVYAYGFPNEYSQVLLNFLNNAKDVFIEKKIPRPRVTVKLFTQDSRSVLTVGDNGGGIPKDIMDKIFEPYFSTKQNGQGTGIGLYMSKMIIEKSMSGKLTATNTGEGAEFRIEL
jgi:PAS domain S-box-containing protein